MCCCCCKCCPDLGCPQWPDRCCLCFTKRAGAVFTGLCSILGNLAILLPCVYALVQQEFWNQAYKILEEWVVHNHWDSAVTSKSLEVLGLVSEHHALFLIVVIAYAALHIFNSLLLIIGALLEKRLMFLPWMVQDMLTILLVGLLFVFWAFFSFFVHVLVAVFFPVVAGLLLGFWIYLWRNVKELFHALGDDDSQQHTGTVYRKLPAGSAGVGTRSLVMT